MSAPVLPRYADRYLGNVLRSCAAHLGLPGATDVLGLPAADAYVVMLVDGLGYELLTGHAGLAPYLAAVAQRTEPLTVGCPATTSASITSLGTGMAPGESGIVGFRFLLPETDELFIPLVWDSALPPEAVQPEPTMFQTLARAGIRATTVMPERFEGSGLTRCGLRGGDFRGVPMDLSRRHVPTIVAADAEGPGLTYAYVRDLDHAGHAHGVDSDEWRRALAAVDSCARELRAALPAATRLIVTGDHGMIDVAADRRIVLEDDPRLARDVDAVGGEGRLRHLYTANPEAVAAAWRDVLGDERAWVRTRAEAVGEGWFGDVEPDYEDRLGDVVVAMRGSWAVLTRTYPQEFGLVGMHASLTSAEMLVPLAVD